MDLNGLLRELSKVRDLTDPADRRWSWATSYLGRALDLPRIDGAKRIRAMSLSDEIAEDTIKARLSDVDCAVLVATSQSAAEAATREATALVANPAASLSGALIVLRKVAETPRMVNAVAAADGPLTSALKTFLGPAGLSVVEASLEGDDTAELNVAVSLIETPAPPAPFTLHGHAWLAAVDESHLVGDIVALELPTKGKRRQLFPKGRQRRPPEVAVGDWLALTGIDGTVVPEVSHVVRVAFVNQGPSSAAVVFDRVQLVPEHARGLLADPASADLEAGHALPVTPEDIARLLEASGVHDPDGLAASHSRLTPDIVRDAAPRLWLPHRKLLACTSSLAAGRHLIVCGATGTGKTTLVRALADAALRIGLLTSPALSIGKEANNSDGGFLPNPFDYRSPSYESLGYAPSRSRTRRAGPERNETTDWKLSAPGTASPAPPVARPPWALVDDLTAERAGERCERALKVVAGDGIGRVLVTTCLTPDEMAISLGPALLRRFAIVEVEAPQLSEDWRWLIDLHGSSLPTAARDRLLELALSGDTSPGTLIDRMRQVGCLLVTGVSADEAMAVAFSTR